MTINAKYIRESEKSETLLINEVSKLKETACETVYKFGFGQSPFLPPQHVIDKLKDYSHRKEYAAVQGLQDLREAAANYHNHYDKLAINADDVLVGPGSKMLIYSILCAFTKADVMVVTPSWVSYEPQAKLAKLNSIRINTTYESRWRLTPELVKAAYESKEDKDVPSVLILNYPGNPDGLNYNDAELEALAQAFRECNILVISDEIYGFLNHDNEHISLARHYPEGTIVTTGLSKWCGAGGWRLGVALLSPSLDPRLKDSIIGIASETYSCAPVPVQFAAVEAYQVDARIEAYLSGQRRILKCIAMHMYKRLKAIGVNIHEPQGGFYLNPDFSPFADSLKERGITTSEELCEQLLKDKSVAVLPGSSFGYPSDALITRIAYVDFDGTAALAALNTVSGELDDAFLNKYCPKVVEGTQRLVDWLSNA